MWKSFWFVLLVLSLGLEARIERVGEGGFSVEESRALAALPTVPAGLNQGYTIERAPSKKVDCRLVKEVKAPQLAAKDWIFYAAQAPNLPSQKVHYVKSNPHGKLVAEPEIQKRVLLAIPVGGKGKSPSEVSVRVYTGAQLFSRKLVRGTTPQKVSPLTEIDRKLALRPTDFYDYENASVKALIREKGLVRKRGEGEVDFGRRVFQAIARNFRYEYKKGMERSAGRVCELGQSDCGGLSALFVTVMRSRGIPARCLSGRWAQSSKAGDRNGGLPYYQTHVKAEFFAQGVGWVPVDVSAAVSHDKTKEKLTYFGNDKGDFLTAHIDKGVSVDSRFSGKKRLGGLQGLAYWARGSGNFNGSSVVEAWEVK